MDYHHPRIAEIYDLINPRAEDIDFYLALAGPQPCHVLDLGCGTGTLCCALAERGHNVTGVDPAAAMLAVARRKPYADQIEWVESSAQAYRSNRRFDLIVMTGHAFQVLQSDADALSLFGTMAGHLNYPGRIAFETRNPRFDWAQAWSTRPPRVHNLPGQDLVETLEIIATDREFISFRTTYRLANEILTTSSTLRFPSREHVENLLSDSGLVVSDVFGDWLSTPFDAAQSKEIIFVVQRAG